MIDGILATGLLVKLLSIYCLMSRLYVMSISVAMWFRILFALEATSLLFGKNIVKMFVVESSGSFGCCVNVSNELSNTFFMLSGSVTDGIGVGVCSCLKSISGMAVAMGSMCIRRMSLPNVKSGGELYFVVISL